MIQVQIDGAPLTADIGAMNNMGDLLELVKATIDPDSIITSIEFNGESLNEGDWSLPLSAHRGRVLEIRTGTKQAYLLERVSLAPDIVEKISEEFRIAGDAYRSGQMPAGNTQLSTAVDDLGAFVNWYSSLLSMDVGTMGSSKTDFHGQVDLLRTICEQILQQQLYNSWWVLAETISTRLNPKLDEIKTLCTQISSSVAAPN